MTGEVGARRRPREVGKWIAGNVVAVDLGGMLRMSVVELP
jgi:hypothetical protein